MFPRSGPLVTAPITELPDNYKLRNSTDPAYNIPARTTQNLDRCMRIRWRGSPFTEQSPIDSSCIVDMFTGRY
jgi:hypothetical protein